MVPCPARLLLALSSLHTVFRLLPVLASAPRSLCQPRVGVSVHEEARAGPVRSLAHLAPQQCPRPSGSVPRLSVLQSPMCCVCFLIPVYGNV